MEKELSNENYNKMIKEVREVDEEQNKKYQQKKEKEKKIKKLAKYIEEHLDSVDGYEGSHYLEWKNKEEYDIEDFYIKIAEDIINFLKK